MTQFATTEARSAERDAGLQLSRIKANNVLIEWSIWGLFALLFGLITVSHEPWGDEVQAWLIARDNSSLLGLLHSLRYEGHPALWYLLLYIPAHLGWTPATMQVFNYLFGLVEAWLVLSARKLQLPIRVLGIFALITFYGYAELARSYLLTVLLLTAAMRCLLAERRHWKFALLLLALACNTHILAIPIAGAIALWGFVLDRPGKLRETRGIFRDAQFWAALVVLSASVAVAYFTVRPAPDLIGRQASFLPAEHYSLVQKIELAVGRAWDAFFPVSADHLPGFMRHWIPLYFQLSLPSCAFSLALLLLISASLGTQRARSFFLISTVLELLAMAVTVIDPWTLRYLGFLFMGFLFALMIDAYAPLAKAPRAHLTQIAATTLILAILSFQALTGVLIAGSSLLAPTFRPSEIADWLKAQGLDKNPLVLDGWDAYALLGYLDRPSAYLARCQCFSSYVVWTDKYDSGRHTSLDDLKIARGSDPRPVIVVRSNGKFNQAETQELGLVEVHSLVAMNKTFAVYEQKNP